MRRLPIGLVAAAWVALGCASVPEPKGELANADLALRKAESVNAAELAPLDARLAREKLEQAKLDQSKGRNQDARRLAEQAEVDALVAEAKARSTRVQRATEEKQNQIDLLRKGASPEGGTR
jgi:hypothetical protein